MMSKRLQKRSGLMLLIVSCMGFNACQSSSKAYHASLDLREPAVSKNEKKDYFKYVTDAERDTLIQNASVFMVPVQSPVGKSVAQILTEHCGESYKYTYDSSTQEYVWPVIECRYKPDADMTGQSAKFKCEFPDGNGGTNTQKIKYSQKPTLPASSEVLEVFLGSTMAHLMGFRAGTYCPASLTCKDCPSSDPWSNARSSVPAVAGQESHFPYVVVEFPEKGYEVSSRAPNPKPQGLAWEELKKVSGSDLEKKNKLIEREAWMMWINFLRHYDADPHNQKILCTEVVESKEASRIKLDCVKSSIYTSDYGLSFPRASHWVWNEPIAKQDGDLCIGTLKKGLIGGAPGAGIILKPSFSEEARQLFLQKIEQISDAQWREVFALAQYGTFSGTNIDTWMDTLKEKIRKLKKLNCPTFDSGRSVLGH